jgi:hypothetical protein
MDTDHSLVLHFVGSLQLGDSGTAKIMTFLRKLFFYFFSGIDSVNGIQSISLKSFMIRISSIVFLGVAHLCYYITWRACEKELAVNNFTSMAHVS